MGEETTASRKGEIANVLDFMSQQFASFSILEELPKDDAQRENVISCAVDVISASMAYLTVQIREHSRSGLSVVVRSVLPIKAHAMDQQLRASVDSFNRALSLMNIKATLKTFELLEGTPSAFAHIWILVNVQGWLH
jgi:hypothetical protein